MRVNILLLPLLAFVMGCTSSSLTTGTRSTIRLFFDNKQMSDEVSRHIHVGMTVNDSKKILLKSGFREQEWIFDADVPVRFIAKFRTNLAELSTDEIIVDLHHRNSTLYNVKVICRTVGP